VPRRGRGETREPAQGGEPGVGASGQPQAPGPLTERQRQILYQVALGRTNRMIGEQLGISELTVRNHLRMINRKLSSPDRTHAVVLAISNGWIAIPIEGEPAVEPARRTGVRPQTDPSRS
jgi:DNA-binding CsgD family transcriptional regulator